MVLARFSTPAFLALALLLMSGGLCCLNGYVHAMDDFRLPICSARA